MSFYVKDADLYHPKIIEARAFGARTRRVLKNKNAVFIATTLHLIPQLSQLSPLQKQESPSLDCIDDTHDNNYVLSDAKMCATALLP